MRTFPPATSYDLKLAAGRWAAWKHQLAGDTGPPPPPPVLPACGRFPPPWLVNARLQHTKRSYFTHVTGPSKQPYRKGIMEAGVHGRADLL
jgi:hypothetical protein